MTGHSEHASLQTRRPVHGSDRGADHDCDDQNGRDGPEHCDTPRPGPATSAGLALLSPAKVEDRSRAHHVGGIGGTRGVGGDDGTERSSRGIGRVGVDDEAVIERVILVLHAQAATTQAAKRPHPDRVVHDPGQPDLAGRITRDEPGDDREEAESGERPDDEFHE
jgi:hypothetical protein